MEDSSSANKSSRILKKKDIAEVEGKVDKILFDKEKRASPETKDSANQKHQSPISNKLKRFDTESFSSEIKNKKPIYSVKVKKDSDGEKKKIITWKKSKKIFHKDEEPTEKIGLSDEHYPQKAVGKYAGIKDSANQKHQSPISNKLKRFDTESFSSEIKNKKPIYSVKVKKDSDGEKKKIITWKKSKKIFHKDEEPTEKIGLSDEHYPQKAVGKYAGIKDSANQKHQSPISNKLKRFDTESFSSEIKNKKPIYSVKVKKDSDGEKKKIITWKKSKKIFHKDEEPTEKIGLSDEHYPQKAVGKYAGIKDSANQKHQSPISNKLKRFDTESFSSEIKNKKPIYSVKVKKDSDGEKKKIITWKKSKKIFHKDEEPTEKIGLSDEHYPQKAVGKSAGIKDSANQKHQSPISNKLKRFDTESFSSEIKNKKPIYSVKVKKDSDGEKKKIITWKKSKKIFHKDEEPTEKIGLSDEHYPQKAVGKSAGIKDSANQKHQSPISNKLKRFDTESFSSEIKNKKPIYSVKVKKDSDGEKKKIITWKKSKKIFHKDEEPTEKIGLSDEHYPQKAVGKSAGIKDSANQKHQSPISNKLKRFDTESFSSEIKNKKPIYSVKVKKDSDGEKKKIITWKKSKKIFHKDEEPTEKIGLSDEHYPQKAVGKSATRISPDIAKWLDEQINKLPKERNNVSDSTSTDDKPFQKSSIAPKVEREKTSTVEKFEKKTDEEKDTKHRSVGEGDNESFQLGEYNIKTPRRTGMETIENAVESKPKKDEDKEKTPSPVKKIEIEGITPDGDIKFINEANQLKSVTLQILGYSEGLWDELDFYPLEEPFAYVEITQEKDTLDKRYVLVEAELSKDEARILKFMEETLSGFSFDTTELESKGEESCLIKRIDQIIDDYALKIDTPSKKKIVYLLKKQFLGLGRLEILMKDPNIEDISCDGSTTPIFLYHRHYGSLKSNVQFDNEEELSDFVMKLAQKCGKHISIAEPMLDATMPDGSRIQTTLSTEITTKGSTFTIRKFKEDPFSPPDLIEFNTMSAEMIAYLWLAVENGINALVAGGTAAGKTSTLNAFSLFIPREAKIVSIEETREVNLPHPNWIPGVARSGFGEVVSGKVVGEIDMYDLMKAALRQRPEYILVGEIRGREAYVLFQAMATGHTTYSTVHADSASSLIHRLEGKPINIPRIMLQALDIVCIQVISRIKNKRARRCKQIVEIIDIDPTTKEILTNEVFRWDPVDDIFIYNGKSYILERIRAEKDLSRDEMAQEIQRRSQLLNWMNKNNVREFKKVSTLIARYVENPAQLMEKIQDGKLL